MRLEAENSAEYAKGNDGNATPAQSAATSAVWHHINGTLSETVPTTAAGCVALARFIPPLFDRWGASLDGEQAGKLFRLIERSPAHQPEHSEGPEADAELIEIGRQWPGLVKAYLSADSRVHDVEELDEEPQRQKELNVYSFDNLNGFPRTEDWGSRFAPYDADQIEELRAVPRVAVYLATPRGGIRREDGTFLNINEAAQRRAESIIEAWDRWQAEIAAYEAKHDLPALRASCREATAAYDAAILKARSLPAQTAAGLLVKARIAAELCPFGFKEDDDALDENAILKSVLADLLKIGQPSATTLWAAETDPAAIASGRTAVGA
ncbi:hypothetical protein JCM2811A_30020 [Methylorubrum rhodinum]